MQYNLDFQNQPVMSLADVALSQQPTLYIHDELGGHRAATPHEILAAASVAIDSLTLIKEDLSHPNRVKKFFQIKLAHVVVERFSIIYLDSLLRLIAYEEPFRGTLTQCSVYSREIVRDAMRHNAAAVVIAHNHPSGDSTPSQADVELTRQLKKALALLDVRLVDHIIVAGNQINSMSESGLLY